MSLPRDNKKTNFEDYTNKEVRTAIEWSIKYINNPKVLRIIHPLIYLKWKDYEKRVTDANYNYWIICYPFGI